MQGQSILLIAGMTRRFSALPVRPFSPSKQVGWGERSEPQQIVGLRRFEPNPTYIENIFEIASSQLHARLETLTC